MSAIVSATVEQVSIPMLKSIGDIGDDGGARRDARRRWAGAGFLKLRQEIFGHINERAEEDRFP